MKKVCMIVISAVLLSGCAIPRIPFPEEELAAINLSGDKGVTGKIFLIDQNEEEQVGANSEITLEPVSSYSNHWYEVVYLNNRAIEEAHPHYENYVLRTTADKEGKFVFKDIAPGNYYLSGPVFWEATTCSARTVRTKVMISKKITVGPNDQVLDIPLTKDYQSPVIICDLYTQGAWEKEDGL